MPGELKGKIAVVTGASRGIGKGIALELGRAGAIVYLTGRTLLKGDSQPDEGRVATVHRPSGRSTSSGP